METIRNNRVTAGIVGGAAVLILLAVLLSGGGNDERESDSAAFNPSSTSTPSASAAPTTPEEFPLTEVPQLNCGPVLTIEEEEEGLGLNDRPFDEGSTFQFASSETCTIQLASDERFFVQVTPGTPADFEPGIERLGVTGQLVQGIGDRAIWFGGPDSSDGGRAGVLSVAENTPLGLLIFRIVLGRPDLDESAQLEVATTLALAALPRFPGVEAPPPPPPPPLTVTRIQPEPADLSGVSYAGNLLQKEADGAWTRGEGLVATLRLLAGEASAADVLLDDELFDFGTEIVLLAREYLENDNPAMAEEIERLLEQLILVPLLEDDGAEPQSSTATQQLAVSRAGALQPGDECTYGRWFGDVPGVCNSKLEEGVVEGSAYRLFGPPDESYGWTRQHTVTIKAYVEFALRRFEDLAVPVGSVDVFETAFENTNGLVSVETDGRCIVNVDQGWQRLESGRQGQAIALLLGGCATRRGFPAGSIGRSWEAGAAWFFSDILWAEAQLEIVGKMPAKLAAVELSKSLLDQNLTTWAFLEHVESLNSVMAILNATTLSSVNDIDRLHHRYAQDLADGGVKDWMRGKHSYPVLSSRQESIVEPREIVADVAQFGTARFELFIDVDGDEYACFTYPPTPAPLLVSWRPGTLGSSGSWSEELPTAIKGGSQGVFVITAKVDSQFKLKVTAVGEGEDCMDDEEEASGNSVLPADDADCGLCGVTRYLYDLVFN